MRSQAQPFVRGLRRIGLSALVVGVGLFGLAGVATPSRGSIPPTAPEASSAGDLPEVALAPLAVEPATAGSNIEFWEQPGISAPEVFATNRPRLATGSPRWLRGVRETGLWSGPEGEGKFTQAPPGAIFRTLDRQAGRWRVYYPGDEEQRAPGEAWVDVTDVNESAWPRFVRARSTAVLRAEPHEHSPVIATLPRRSYVEVVETAGRDWALVFLVASSETGETVVGWIDGEDAAPPPRDPGEFAGYVVTRDVLQRSKPEAWLPIPYRSQLDGSAYASANCGPTAIWMALRAFGPTPGPGQLRDEVLDLQNEVGCDDCGVFIQHLSTVVERHGTRTFGLFDRAPDDFHRWTADEIRRQLQAGRVVIPQVMFRMLSGHEKSGYWGDHYVTITGYLGDKFIYHDPIDIGGPGPGRIISAAGLMKAMAASDYPSAAFAAGP